MNVNAKIMKKPKLNRSEEVSQQAGGAVVYYYLKHCFVLNIDLNVWGLGFGPFLILSLCF